MVDSGVELTMQKRMDQIDSLIADMKACDRSLCKGLKDVKDRQEVNLWNHWQGALDAQLMLIGQDFGNANTQCVNVPSMQAGRPWHRGPDGAVTSRGKWAQTDRIIYDLFLDVFGVDLSLPQKLYFSNVACCYREGKTSGVVAELDYWLPYCASKYMGRLLKIIRPKAVIVLGERVLDALAYCENAVLSKKQTPQGVDCLRGNARGFARAINFDYTLSFSDDPSLTVHVYPTYHPEYYIRVPNGRETQIAVWTSIKNRLDALDSSILGNLRDTSS